jgi:hypothetical protein
LLYVIDLLDRTDKHRLLTPIADYRTVSSDIYRRQIPDFPYMGFYNNLFRGGINIPDFIWSFDPLHTTVSGVVIPNTCVLEQELDIPMTISLDIGRSSYRYPLIPTLDKLVDIVRSVLRVMKDAVI